MDRHGACKVCDGEIPNGHTSDCEYHKLSMQNIRMKEALLNVNSVFERMNTPMNDIMGDDEHEAWRLVQEALEITERKKK